MTTSGQLGLGLEEKEVATPQHIADLGNSIRSISCGGNHSLVVTIDNKIYSW